jgi:hypothetical protein
MWKEYFELDYPSWGLCDSARSLTSIKMLRCWAKKRPVLQDLMVAS